MSRSGGLSSVLSAVLIVQFLVSPIVYAGKLTVVVVPVYDSVSDDSSTDLADSFSELFREEGLEVVSKDKVQSVLQYYSPSKLDKEGEYISDTKYSLIKAKEHYFNFEYSDALAQIQNAISILEANQSGISKHGTLLRDSYITAGIIERSKKGRDENAVEYFKKALALDPHYGLDKKAFPPSTINLFEDARRDVLDCEKGLINVTSDPKVAEVYLNGVLKGATPVTLSDLPVGKYNILINTNKYGPIERTVQVTSNQIASVDEKLTWMGDAGNQKSIQNILNSPDQVRAQIEEGMRITEALRVPKVIMVDADEVADGSGEIAIRMVDREFQAGHNPIIVAYDSDKEFLAKNLAEAAKALLRQTRVSVINNPKKYVDPDGIGDPILLGKRHKALYTIPAFWALVGGVIAATAGGAVAGVVLSGSKNPTGSVSVQFK